MKSIANEIELLENTGREIRAQMARTGLTGTTIAKEMGVDRNTVARWIDTGRMKLPQFLQICRLIKVSPAKILQLAIEASQEK